MRVCFLKVIHASEREKLQYLVSGGSALHMLRERRAGEGGGDVEQLVGQRRLIAHRSGHRSMRIVIQRCLEYLLEPSTRTQNFGIPFVSVRDVVERAVVQFIQHPQPELDIVVANDHLGFRCADARTEFDG